MREIKFRVWCPLLGRFALDTEDGYIYQEDDFDSGEFSVGSGDGGVVQQFTGLKDKNGREIYEGDIVKTIYIDSDKLGEIIFHAETGTYRIKTKERLLPIVTCRFTEDKTPYLQPVTDEIVGNIFENRELLTENSEILE